MSARVGVFCSKRRPKGIDLAERAGVALQIELTADREEGFGTKKILIKLIGFTLMNLIECRHAKQIAGTLAVTGRNDGGIHPIKILTIEKAVNLGAQRVTNPRQRAEGIRPRAEVSDASQVFKGVLFLADRVGFRVINQAVYDNAIGLNFSILALALGFHQLTRDGYGTPGPGFDDLCIIFQGVVRDRLNGAETRAVVNVQERETSLGRASRAQPATNRDIAVNGGVVLQNGFDCHNHNFSKALKMDRIARRQIIKQAVPFFCLAASDRR